MVASTIAIMSLPRGGKIAFPGIYYYAGIIVCVCVCLVCPVVSQCVYFPKHCFQSGTRLTPPLPRHPAGLVGM